MAEIGHLRTSAAALIHLRAAVVPLIHHLLRPIRSYATSAAQPQVDHDYYYEYYGQKGRAPMVDSEGSIPLRGVQWAFIGSPAAKKHVYAERISKLLGVPHISIGSLVRQDLNPRSSLYKQIANAVNQGKLVPEDIMFGLLSKRLEDGYYKGETGFILDGIPRTKIQAEILDKLVDIDLVLNFKCNEDCLLEHHGDSIFSPSQQHCFSSSASAIHDMESRDMQSKYSIHNTDSAWKGKDDVHAKQLLEDYYKKQKKLIDFQVGGAPIETWQELLATLHLQHINAAHSRLTSGSEWL